MMKVLHPLTDEQLAQLEQAEGPLACYCCGAEYTTKGDKIRHIRANMNDPYLYHGNHEDVALQNQWDL